MPSAILMIRHCQSTGQAPDAPLTPEGHMSAVALTETLTRIGVSALYSSPYRRARETLAPYSNQTGLEVKLDARLRERTLASQDLPDWRDQIAKSFLDRDHRAPGGESFNEVAARATAALSEIAKAGHRAPAVATHGNLLSALISAGDPEFGFESWMGMRNPDLFEAQLNGGEIVSIRRLHIPTAEASPLRLIKPSPAYLPGYVAALEAGWSPSTGDPEAGRRALAKIAEDPDAYLASLDDIEAKGEPIRQANGELRPRIPGFARWLWDSAFCGTISLRWVPSTIDLPTHVSGHIGYGVVPWKRRRGYATQALALLLPEAKALGLAHVDITTNTDNVSSQRVIEANGGILIDPAFSNKFLSARMLYRIWL